MLKQQLDAKLQQALVGRSIYVELLQAYRIEDNDLLFVIDDSDAAFFQALLPYLPVISRNVNKAVYFVIADSYAHESSLQQLTCIFKRSADIESIIQFYSLYMFAANVVFLSYRGIEARTTANLIAQQQLTLDDYIHALLKNYLP